MQQYQRKRIKTLVWILCAIFVVIIGGFVWWNAPSPITNISPPNVSKIVIFDGHTGKALTIKNKVEIKHLVDNLNSVHVNKNQISIGYMGYGFRTRIYGTKGGVYKSFIIESRNIIRKDPFFYKARSNSIDYNYVQSLISNSAK